MKRMLATVVVATLIGLAGCNDKGTPGGPGVSNASGKRPGLGEAEDSFSLSVPAFSTKLKQGEAKQVSIGVKRGTNFNEDVALMFEGLPKGVSIEPSRPEIKHGEKEATVTVKAADDAALGDFTVKITGQPSKGSYATHEMKITIERK
jgi:uncharacterized membrane protein